MQIFNKVNKQQSVSTYISCILYYVVYMCAAVMKDLLGFVWKFMVVVEIAKKSDIDARINRKRKMNTKKTNIEL